MNTNNETKAILFVCMGNICRSPTAQGVMQKLLEDRGLTDRIRLDSAGTHAYHVGEAPDQRAIDAALDRGVEISHLRARKVTTEDFHAFDLVLAMDAGNLEELVALQPENGRAELKLLLHYSKTDRDGTIPDPYYGGAVGFERVLDLLEEVSNELLTELLDQ